MGVSIAVGAAAIIGATATVVSSNNASNEAEAQMAQQKQYQDKALSDEKDQEQANIDNQQRDSSKLIRQAQGMAAQGNAGTKLTSPLGVANPNNQVANKTVLGS